MTLPIIYLDYNATTPLAPEVADAMRPFLTGGFGNPSSSHPFGAEARQAVELARRQVAALLGCQPDEIVFTSGGSESDNMAIKGVAGELRQRGNHIVTSSIEHPAVSEVCAWLAGEGYEITMVPVDATGRVDPAAVEAALRPTTILVTVMHANNEVGTIQPVARIAELARARGILVHSDGAQAAGKIPVDVGSLGVDLYTVAGHKFQAPKGVGALYIRRGVRLARYLHGADHEGRRRAGTENTLGLAGLGAAADLARRRLESHAAHLRAMRDRLHRAILDRVPDARLNGHPEERLPNTLSLSFPGLDANTILDALQDRVAASAGAACHAGEVTLSKVLVAMGIPEYVARGTIRFSTGAGSTAEEMDRAAAAVADVVQSLRGAGPVCELPLDGGIRLTAFTHGLGCACKLRPQILEEVLRGFPPATHADALVGFETSDDAAVWRLSEDQALIGTVDFFTPVVDSPRDFGAIAVANALSDVYAMGGRPLFALNLVAFPPGRLPLSVLREILDGARGKAEEAGIPILGGHSIEDLEPKFGLAVYGLVHPAAIWRNIGARPGDALLITKPAGSGILATAGKRGLASPDALQRATAVMAALNRDAARILAGFEVHACTDVTGFGLLGHLREMAAGSRVDVTVHAGRVPLLPEALDLAVAGAIPGGTEANRAWLGAAVSRDPAVAEAEYLVFCDAQTSGGLLAALPAVQAQAALGALLDGGVSGSAIIGEISGPGEGRIHVERSSGGKPGAGRAGE